MKKLLIILALLASTAVPTLGQELSPANTVLQQANIQDTQFRREVRRHLRSSNLTRTQKLNVRIGMLLYGDYIEKHVTIKLSLEGKVQANGQIDWDSIDWEELLKLILAIIEAISELFGTGLGGGPPDVIISQTPIIVPPVIATPTRILSPEKPIVRRIVVPQPTKTVIVQPQTQVQTQTKT